ncbi:unnamed protein product, partial [Dracunculus medinensis]|uniref:Lysosomal acid phosphatase n=1 Tax=Dracunculus medinensis TaxID=318479 RepID=A0A0N4UG41_DRAME
FWRHGDRTPIGVCKGDKNQEKRWNREWGQLTPVLFYFIMKNTIYVASTDCNRTILSAVSNLIGMFYNKNNARPDIDFPNIPEWPKNYVPVPVHTNVSRAYCVQIRLVSNSKLREFIRNFLLIFISFIEPF